MEHQACYSAVGSLNNDYRAGLAHLMEYGHAVSPRGPQTKELLNYNFTLTDPRNRIVNFPDRKTSLKYLLGEFCWYLSGSDNPDGILPYAKFWDNLRNTGDMTGYPKSTVNSNYGYRLFGHSMLPAFAVFDNYEAFASINQWNDTIKLLQEDKSSRQAVMNIHVPSDRHAGNKDVCCTLTLQWLIRDDHLHLIVNMRSADIILGVSNDIFQFTMLQEAMCLQLREFYPELELGAYYHNCGSLHVYDRHFDMANKIIADERAFELSMIPMDAWNDRVCLGLITCEQIWRDAGCDPAFDITKLDCWQLLTPYWQNLFRMCFLEDEEALHDVFGIPEH